MISSNGQQEPAKLSISGLYTVGFQAVSDSCYVLFDTGLLVIEPIGGGEERRLSVFDEKDYMPAVGFAVSPDRSTGVISFRSSSRALLYNFTSGRTREVSFSDARGSHAPWLTFIGPNEVLTPVGTVLNVKNGTWTPIPDFAPLPDDALVRYAQSICSVSSDGARYALLDSGGVSIRDSGSSRVLWSVQPKGGKVLDIDMIEEGDSVAVLSEDLYLRIYNRGGLKTQRLLTHSFPRLGGLAHDSPREIRFACDSNTFFVSSWNSIYGFSLRDK